MRIHGEWEYFLLASRHKQLSLGLSIVLVFPFGKKYRKAEELQEEFREQKEREQRARSKIFYKLPHFSVILILTADKKGS